MGEYPRFCVFFERHVGLGIRWDLNTGTYAVLLAVSVMCVTFNIGIWRFGK